MLPSVPALRRIVRRHRRPIAAASAGISVLFMIAALRPEPIEAPLVESAPRLHAGEVGIPIAIANASLVSMIRDGDVVDVLAITEASPVRVAEAVRVVDATEQGVLLLAVPQSDTSAVQELAMDIPFAVHLHAPSIR